jgi:hypothetical protein
MDRISAADLLEAWERGRHSSPGERGLLLLALANPEAPGEALATWSVGQRDAALLAMRERIFGPQLKGLASCPQCGEALEMQFAVADILASARPDQPATLCLAMEGCRVTFRLPNAGDVAALAGAKGQPEPGRWLLERCIIEAWREDAPCAVVNLPDKLLEAMTAAMAEADPQAEVELLLRCLMCGNQWLAPFDVVSFLWREIDAWAARVLREVHQLASVYGWSERDILALSPWRRRYYLELIAK